ncbi:thiopurine S-methyltransferase [Pseudomonas akapageensis]|uniref:thiopurine S-methyltransferase n=1 Tax=Pseudomonas akapageensis TaxID=2609961 RepID=UPI001409905A|nr:thiopurine S-methyltransferase [Pseudomonas akapageensis]
MEPEFWHKRWEQNQIGFHQEDVNPCLQRYWPGLGLASGARVLVPLCGKSLDMVWLAGQGLRVLGVELSSRAVEDFCREQQLQPQINRRGAFTVYQCDGIELWCGDIFALSAADVADCVGLYDRAALIALPAEMRERYCAHLDGILPRECRGLLVTLEYDQAAMAGPPFSVTDDEVQARLAAHWQLQTLESLDVLAQSPKFLQAGVSRLQERVYRLQRD